MDPRVAYLSPMPPARRPASRRTRRRCSRACDRIGYTPGEAQAPAVLADRAQARGRRSRGTRWACTTWATTSSSTATSTGLAIRTPGLVVIHDLALDDFVRGMVATGEPLGHQAMREGLLHAPRLHGFEEAERNEPLRVPYVAHAAPERAGHRRPLAVRRALPARVRLQHADLRRAAPGRRDRAGRPQRPSAARPVDPRVARVDGDADAVVVAGDQNEAKLIDACSRRSVHLPEDVHLALVGRRIPGYDLGRRRAGERARRPRVVHTDVIDEDFLGLAVRRRRRGGPALPAPRRGERLARRARCSAAAPRS